MGSGLLSRLISGISTFLGPDVPVEKVRRYEPQHPENRPLSTPRSRGPGDRGNEELVRSRYARANNSGMHTRIADQDAREAALVRQAIRLSKQTFWEDEEKRQLQQAIRNSEHTLRQEETRQQEQATLNSIHTAKREEEKRRPRAAEPDPAPTIVEEQPAPRIESRVVQRTRKRGRADWQRLNNNCAEMAIATLSRKFGAPMPRFDYGRSIQTIDDIQLEFGPCVDALNRTKRHELPYEVTRIPAGTRQENGRNRTHRLADYLNGNDKREVFLMRTGPRDNSGHFQVVFFDDRRQCWQAFSSEKNKFNITNPGNTQVTAECCEKLEGSERFRVTLSRLHIEDIQLYEQFVVECRRRGVSFVRPEQATLAAPNIPPFKCNNNGALTLQWEEAFARTALENEITYVVDGDGFSRLAECADALPKFDVHTINTIFLSSARREDETALQQFMRDGDKDAFKRKLGAQPFLNDAAIGTLDKLRSKGLKAYCLDIDPREGSKKIAAVSNGNPDMKALVWAPQLRKNQLNRLPPGPILRFAKATAHVRRGAAYFHERDHPRNPGIVIYQ
jgi:hypothetical protein